MITRCLISATFVNRKRFRTNLRQGNKKKSASTKSGVWKDSDFALSKKVEHADRSVRMGIVVEEIQPTGGRGGWERGRGEGRREWREGRGRKQINGVHIGLT